MLDFLNTNFSGDIQIFNNATSGTASWSVWTKPRGVKMVALLLLSGGSAGGAGFSSASGNARGGGGGGSSSGVAYMFMPAMLMPDRLSVHAGRGGIGGVGSGGAGTKSQVSIAPITDVPTNTYAICTAPNAGAVGTGSGGGAGGVANSAGANATCCLGSGIGLNTYITGHGGANGGAHTGAIGGAIALPTTGIFCLGGCGGAGTQSADFAGGIFTPIAGTLLSEAIPAGAAAGSNPGSAGTQLWKPFYSFGGCGGSSSDTGVGGAGGKGAYGAGGGGGGGGTTGGKGGDGGDGIVIFWAW